MRDDIHPPPDAHLKAALAHAPDAQVEPPAALSESILQAARKVASAQPRARAAASVPAWLRAWAQVWHALGRGPAAGAMAGLMVATLVGVMWWGSDPSDSLPQRSAVGVGREQAPAPAPTSTSAARAKGDRESPAGGALGRAGAAAPGLAADQRSASAPAMTPKSGELAEASLASAETPALPARPAAAVPPEQPLSQESLVASRGVSRPVSPGVNLGELLQHGSKATWQPGSLSARPVTPELTAWLAQVHQRTSGAWLRAGDLPTGTPWATWIWRDGDQVHAFRLSATRLRWSRPDGSVWEAEIDETTASTWRQRWTALQAP